MTGRKESGISEILDRKRLRRMAGAQSFARGEDYFADGQVGSIVEHHWTIAAISVQLKFFALLSEQPVAEAHGVSE